MGDGPQRPVVEAAAAGIADHVRFAGALTDADLHSLLAAADWFVHPTRYEGSSIVTLEAMAHGLPVVTSNVGGHEEAVLHGETGFLVQPGDEVALREALRTLLDDGELRRDMGRRGRERYRALFTRTRNLQSWLRLLREGGVDG